MFLASVISYASNPLLAFQVYFSTFGFPITGFTRYSNATRGEVFFCVLAGIPPLTDAATLQIGGFWFYDANGILMGQCCLCLQAYHHQLKVDFEETLVLFIFF